MIFLKIIDSCINENPKEAKEAKSQLKSQLSKETIHLKEEKPNNNDDIDYRALLKLVLNKIDNPKTQALREEVVQYQNNHKCNVWLAGLITILMSGKGLKL